MPKVTININKCKGCKLCTSVCPKKIVVIDKKTLNASGFCPASISEPEKCIGCAFCAQICPDVAIEVEK
ncbi:MAG: 4Fe-4S dicluster domain-containing protein [Clostridiales bacterium]|jgi:2-oxoglutarate ferredoxin oxidoreductase subunit delta|nr:4Fe-4S dicluster domain-containing protein [Clostridiales bacterium]